MTEKLPLRSEVPTELTWDLTRLFASDEAMQHALQATQKRAQALAAMKGQLTSAAKLLQVLQAVKTIDEELEQEYVYAFLRRDSDTTDATATALFGQAARLRPKLKRPWPLLTQKSLPSVMNKWPRGKPLSPA